MLYNYKNENKKLIKKNNETIKTMIDLYNEKVVLQDVNKTLKTQRDNWENEYYDVVNENDKQDKYIVQLQKENKHLKECNLRYRNHNELLESIIGIRKM